jgi:hypothetical protein
MHLWMVELGRAIGWLGVIGATLALIELAYRYAKGEL